MSNFSGGVKHGDGAISRATKKVRRRSKGILDLSDPVVDDQGVKVVQVESPKISWKEKLLGSIRVNESLFSDEDFDLQENDAIIVMVDGILSNIFSDRVHQFIAKRMARTAIVKLIGRSLSYTSMVNRLKILWQTSQPFQVVDLENDYYSVKFVGEAGYHHTLLRGPWTIFGHYLMVNPWSPTFSTTQKQPSDLFVWVRLPGLPEGLYFKSLLNFISGVIGPVAKIDRTTDSKIRGQFARLAMFINVEKPLVLKILIDGKVQRVEYEGLPLVYFGCWRFGHAWEFCHHTNQQDGQEGKKHTEKVKEGMRSGEIIGDEPFGPWILLNGENLVLLRLRQPILLSVMMARRLGVPDLKS